MTAAAAEPEPDTLEELVARLGNLPLGRIRLSPTPGTATEADLLDVHERTNRLFELVDGTLVEKAMGYPQSLLAGEILLLLKLFVKPRKLGLVAGADGMMRIASGLIRIPDVSFVSWAQIPGGRVPREPVPGLYPDLAVEVLSPSNTRAEMARKRREYFAAGTRLVWQFYTDARTAEAFTAPAVSQTFAVGQSLDGDPVLPGFTLLLADLFAELDETP